LRSELSQLRQGQSQTAPEVKQETVRRSTFNTRPDNVPAAPQAAGENLEWRVAALEDSVNRLNDGADHLMDAGELPASAEKLAEWRLAFMNPNLSAEERLSALRMVRRNEGFTEELASAAAGWLASSPGDGTTRSLLQALRGESSPALKAITLQLATTSEDNGVRRRAVENLRGYLEDPNVEAALWELADSDFDDGLSRAVLNTLRRAPVTDSRVATLQARALNASSSLDTRIASMRLLQSANQDISSVAPSLAQTAQSVQERDELISLFRAFDDVNDPNFMLPLVNGLQHNDAEVRVRAADALMDYRDEPNVVAWLEMLAESDPDPRVRQEAMRVFNNGRR
jgi:hypothetical protein